MKNTLLFLMIIMFLNIFNAQNESYTDLWSRVEKHEKEGLPISALKIVEQIIEKAKAENNTPEHIKTMLYKSKYALILEEDAQLSIIEDFESEIEKSDFPKKNILENILANLYWQYFNQHRFQFYNRTKTLEKVTIEDFRTWDLQTLFDEIHVHYKNSLRNGLMLQQEDLKTYNILLNDHKGSKIYRPTLFDFLNHDALQFYKTNETQITKPVYSFRIDNSDFLADSKTFSTLKIESKDITSLQLNTLKIYQDLIQFHLKVKNVEALAIVNIERLKFVHEHATFSDKDPLFLESLQMEKNKAKNIEVLALYNFEIASFLFQEGQTYNPNTKEDNRWKAKEVLEICKTVISEFPKSNGAEKCRVLKSQIKQAALQITTENYLPIQTNNRLLIRYKNINKLDFNIYKVSRNQLEKFNKTYRKDEQLKFIKGLKPSNTWNIILKDEGDYQNHTTEILLPKLDNGTYIIVSDFNSNNETFAFTTFQVTNLALIETESEEYKTFQIIDRNNGAPIINAQEELTYYYRNTRTTKVKNYKTNSLGEVKIEKDNDWYQGINIKVTHNNDVGYFGDYYISKYYKKEEQKISYQSFLFTDRSIYRPGQTIYFKGIAIKKELEKSETLDKEHVLVSLFNVNDEIVSQIKLVTNDFGSVSGEFILPNTGLNGQYHIEIHSETKSLRNNHYFSVEEYKRPRFETTFKPISQTFKVNDTITIKGNALAYAGTNITDAKVVYRVHRKVEYPRWYFWYRPWFNSKPQEITYGATITNNKGEFEITFKAIPDKSVDKASLPVFKYEIIADVTDINGETRSATVVVNVGYHALIANLSVKPLLDKNKKDHTIDIETKNLNGELVSAKGLIKIYKLNVPNTVLRERPWPAPDYQVFSKAEFKKLFPHDAYKNEHNPDNWDKGTLVLEELFNTAESKTLSLGKLKNWKSGKYIIVVESKDKFGQIVKDEVKTTLFSKNDSTIADNQLFQIASDKENYSTGETAEITFGSSAKDIAVTIAVEKNNKIVSTEVCKLSNNKKTISIPINKEDLGGFVVQYSFAAFNSFQSGTLLINVPYPKTDLEIETLTFRDKLQPGTDETWQFKIKGPKGDKVSAELLASMYDASLDQFKPHSWNFNPINHPAYFSSNNRNARQSFGTRQFRVYLERNVLKYPYQKFDQLNWFGFYIGNRRAITLRKSLSSRAPGVAVIEDQMESESLQLNSSDADLEEVIVTGYSDEMEESKIESDEENTKIETDLSPVKIRTNLQETAFFFPQLKTDPEGNVSFSFTTPEALTQWKLQLLVHTKTMESATQTLTTVSQKELMVIPNAPRFLRQGDNIIISSKIANLNDKSLSGQAKLILTDAISGKDISSKLLNASSSKKLDETPFTVDAESNTQVSWNLSIPNDIQSVQYKIIAKSGDFSDGEQNGLPVLSNRMLVTETLPMWIRNNETRTFTLDKLKNNTSSTLKHHKLTLEMTSNPAWYAVQALPYLMEYPYDCNEQRFSRYYANTLASHIVNSNPRIQEVFNQWRNTDALLSNLEKNEELKSILIEETPWLRDAQNEKEQKKRIALLFDLNKMNNELQSAINKLKSNQMSSGAWAWFNGGRENRYITQHIITGFGHLSKLNVSSGDTTPMISKAIKYLDSKFVKEFKDIRKYNAKVDLNLDHLSYTQLHYLYMRSFYPEIKKTKEIENIIEYYQTQIKKYWLKRSLYSKGLMALVSYRNNDNITANKILKSLKETSISSDELGMYWKSNTNSWFWYQAPIETHALLIEAFSEIENDTKTIDNLKIWLLKNKQTNRWKTTKATTEAIYALLLQGSDWLPVNDMVDVVVGEQKIESSKLEDVKVEAGTGYYKTFWNASEIKPEMAHVKITKIGKGIAWGSLYWQYFEDLDKISSAETPLKLKKKLFLKKNTDTGEEISEITKHSDLKVGDLVRVRIELQCDRTMEFIHMKDMRASGLEPVNVLSTYKWQDGLGYYESTKDASTNFFFDNLQKGIYVFEYDLRVNNAGNMSNGITTIQSMYAPEFSSHSEGTRISIK